MSEFTDFLVKVDDLVWGIPLIVLILAAGIYLLSFKTITDSAFA